MRTTSPPDKRPRVCPGCCSALIRARRALPGTFCPPCLQEKVWQQDLKAKRRTGVRP